MKSTRHCILHRLRAHTTMPEPHPCCLKNQQGSMLIGLIVTMSILAVAGAAMISLTATSTYTEIAANRHNAAYYIAESGGNYAIPQIINNANQAITTLHNRTYTLATGQQFTLSLDNTSSTSFIFLTSTGVVSSGSWAEARETITYRFPKTLSTLFDRAIFGNDKIKIKQDSYVDSYKTTWTGKGNDFDENNQLTLVGSNSDKIDIKKDAIVYGTIAINEGKVMTPKTPPTAFNTLTVNGATYAQDAKLELHNTSATISAGTYRLKELEMENATLNISGNVVLHVTEDADFEESSKVILNPGASLTIYFDDDLKIKEGSMINAGGATDKFVAYGTASAKKVDFKGEATFNGVIYAPTAKIKIKGKDNEKDEDDEGDEEDEEDKKDPKPKGPSTVFGSIIGNRVYLQGDSSVHYDEKLMTSGLFSSIASIGKPTQYFTQ